MPAVDLIIKFDKNYQLICRVINYLVTLNLFQ